MVIKNIYSNLDRLEFKVSTPRGITADIKYSNLDRLEFKEINYLISYFALSIFESRQTGI